MAKPPTLLLMTDVVSLIFFDVLLITFIITERFVNSPLTLSTVIWD